MNKRNCVWRRKRRTGMSMKRTAANANEALCGSSVGKALWWQRVSRTLLRTACRIIEHQIAPLLIMLAQQQ